MHSQTHNNIMHRVYLAWGLHVATRPLVRRGVALVLLTYVLSVLVHVSAIISNISAIGVGHLWSYILYTLAHTEFMTLGITALIGLLLVRSVIDVLSSGERRQVVRTG